MSNTTDILIEGEKIYFLGKHLEGISGGNNWCYIFFIASLLADDDRIIKMSQYEWMYLDIKINYKDFSKNGNCKYYQPSISKKYDTLNIVTDEKKLAKNLYIDDCFMFLFINLFVKGFGLKPNRISKNFIKSLIKFKNNNGTIDFDKFHQLEFLSYLIWLENYCEEKEINRSLSPNIKRYSAFIEHDILMDIGCKFDFFKKRESHLKIILIKKGLKR